MVLQDQVADGGVARRHVVEAVFHGRRWPTGQIGHRAAGDQPHHEFDALRAGLADVVDVRLLGEFGRRRDQFVEEGLVEVAVDQTGARALQLVAHPAGAPDLHVEVVVVRLDGAPDRLAQVEAALSRRDRIVDDVDRDRDHPARPRRRLAAQQRQRDGQAVIDGEAVDDREVEVLLDDRVGDVRRQFGVTHDVGHRAWSPPSSATV